MAATTPQSYDVIILGAGAAGMMCAMVAGQRGKSVLLIDHADAPGKKILISGGGRCNFTNVNTVPERFLSANRHFAKSALDRYTPADFIALVDRYGIAWHEKALGQLFCDGSARQIVAMLVDECRAAGVTAAMDCPVRAIAHGDGLFTLSSDHATATAPALVIATGGPSIPKMGATGLAYDIARQFGLKVVEPRPALVPFTLGGEDLLFRDLSGVSAEVLASCGKIRFREAALMTHRGLSGPAILQVSSYWRHGQPIALDFLPDDDVEGWLLSAKRDRPRAALQTILAERLPARLAQVLTERIGHAGEMHSLSDKALRAAAARLSAWEFRPNGTEGFAKAEVTIGGVDTSGLSSQTMAAKHLPGLYFIGEAVDVTGWLGGYNFQWAWASGHAAGVAV